MYRGEKGGEVSRAEHVSWEGRSWSASGTQTLASSWVAAICISIEPSVNGWCRSIYRSPHLFFAELEASARIGARKEEAESVRLKTWRLRRSALR